MFSGFVFEMEPKSIALNETMICSTFLLSFKLEDAVHNMLPRIPIPLQEATSRLVNRQPGPRPTAQLLQLIKYFR